MRGRVASTVRPLPTPDAAGRFDVSAALDLPRTLAPLAHGSGDPALRIAASGAWRATRTPRGPATLHLALERDGGLLAEAWGDGAEWAVSKAAATAGLEDEPERFQPRHAVLRELVRRFPGLRLPASHDPYPALVTAVLEQKVTGVEARRSYRALVWRHGEPAPGPTGLWLLPAPERLASLPYYTLHPLGVERRRAEVLRRVASAAAEGRLATGDPRRLRTVLSGIGGIGPWSVAEVLRVAVGDPDAVSIGDFHLPSVVAWALAGERRADDERMLELLAPYEGQRGRVQRLLEVGGIAPPRRGPRLAPRQIAAI